jgi:hypothetical protein
MHGVYLAIVKNQYFANQGSMTELNSSLLREKFSISDTDPDTHSERSIVALSNRISIELKGFKKEHNESFIIRSHNMHSAVRMAARVLKTHMTGGPIINRINPFDWEAAWDATISDYEFRYNPERWIAIYHKGHIVYESGTHHLLLDVIEKCDARNPNNYDRAIPMAEDAFKQAGKIVKIEYDSNVALVVNMNKTHARFGVILRGPNKTTTFNFAVTPNNKDPLNLPQCLTTAAAYLEGVQLAFELGMNNIKLNLGIIARNSDDEKRVKEAGRRLSRLNAEISNLERAAEVRYRPEKPDFFAIVADAEKLAMKILTPPNDI